jgi:hypothetical protein
VLCFASLVNGAPSVRLSPDGCSGLASFPVLGPVCASEGETLLLPLAASKLLEGPASDELLSVTQLAEAHWHKTKYRDNSRQGGNRNHFIRDNHYISSHARFKPKFSTQVSLLAWVGLLFNTGGLSAICNYAYLDD